MRNKRIKDFPLSLRPQEKLFAKGAQNLSEEELLAILLGTGTRTHNVLSLAKQILKTIPLEQLSSSSKLLSMKGIGKVKAARVLAAIEIGERLFRAPGPTSTTIVSVQDILIQGKDIANKQQEHLLVLYTNARHMLLRKDMIAIGNMNAIGIEPKELFAPAFATPCTGIILIHNHPSGDPTPSDEDITFTKRMLEAGKLLGVTLLDHVIVAKDGYFSFSEGE